MLAQQRRRRRLVHDHAGSRAGDFGECDPRCIGSDRVIERAAPGVGDDQLLRGRIITVAQSRKAKDVGRDGETRVQHQFDRNPLRRVVSLRRRYYQCIEVFSGRKAGGEDLDGETIAVQLIEGIAYGAFGKGAGPRSRRLSGRAL